MNIRKFLGAKSSTLEELKKNNISYDPYVFSDETAVPYGQALSLRASQSPVRDQGQGGTCVPFAVGACAEFVIKNSKGQPPIADIHLSEAHLSHAAEVRRGDCQSGLQIWHALEVIEYYGVVTAEVWPYVQGIYCSPSPPDRSSVPWFQVNTWKLFYFVEQTKIRKVMEDYANGIKSVTINHAASILRDSLINKQAPVLIDIPVTLGNGWDEPTNGDILMPSSNEIALFLKQSNSAIKAPGGTRDWHCVCITGFDDSTSRFEFKNSWGAGWGNGGYGTLPYDYVTSFNRQMWDSFYGRYNSQIGPFPQAI